MSHAKRLRRRDERGQTIILVAFSMLVLLGLAALAIDVVTLYVSRNEAQRAADAAALAGAKALVTSGYTSGWMAGATVCSGLARQQAQAAVAQNPVAGAAPTITTSCSFEPPNNPRITVTVQRTGLPLFFARIWRRTSPGVSATAVAEAFNPSGGTVPIAVGSVKPWAVPNCDPNHATPANPNCGGTAAYFVSPPNYSVAHASSSPPNAIVGSVFDLCEIQNPVPPHQWTYASPTSGTCPYASPDTATILDFLATDVPVNAATVSCPSSSAVSCTGGGLSLNPGAPGYPESIACANSTPLSCGQTLNVHSAPTSSGAFTPRVTAQQAALCLIHASNTGPGNGQDLFCGDPNLPACTAGSPIDVDGGGNNPSPALNGTNNISRSDSIVTVPIWDPGPNGAASNPVTIVGFLQLGIVRVRVAGPLRAVVLNVVGCGSAPYPPTAPVFGGGLSPIPVRLIH
jgi:Flp pilus assembly protein TadG